MRFFKASHERSSTPPFGSELEVHGTGTASLPAGHGNASLGVFRPASAVQLSDADESPRLRFRDPQLGWLRLQVTDIRMCDDEHRPVKELFSVVGRRLAAGDPMGLPLAGRSFLYRPLAVTGDRSAGQVIGEYTLEVRNAAGMGMIAGLAA